MIFTLFFEGPKLPRTLEGHSCVTQGADLIVISGGSATEANTAGEEYRVSSNLYKLKLKNGQFEWSIMNVKLKIPRQQFVASLIPITSTTSQAISRSTANSTMP